MAVKLTAAQRAKRDERIVTMHAARVPWRTIAAHAQLTQRRCEQIVEAWQHKGPRPPKATDVDSDAWLQEMLEGLLVAQQEFAAIGLGAENDANRIGALKGFVETMLIRDDVMRKADLLPRNPAAPQIGAQVQLLFREVGDLLRQEQIAEGVLQRLMELVEARMGRPPDIDGRALPPPA